MFVGGVCKLVIEMVGKGREIEARRGTGMDVTDVTCMAFRNGDPSGAWPSGTWRWSLLKDAGARWSIPVDR